jgi:thiol:disulfide interchange protein
MLLLINSYSLVAAGLLALMIVALLTGRFFGLKWAAATVAITFVSLVAFQITASTKANTVSTPEDFNNALTFGKPVLVELYSDFWITCLRAKPDVDRLEIGLTDHFLVIRLDVLSDVGKYVRQKHQGGVVPTFIVFDKGGNEIWRYSGAVPKLKTILLLGL